MASRLPVSSIIQGTGVDHARIFGNPVSRHDVACGLRLAAADPAAASAPRRHGVLSAPWEGVCRGPQARRAGAGPWARPSSLFTSLTPSASRSPPRRPQRRSCPRAEKPRAGRSQSNRGRRPIEGGRAGGGQPRLAIQETSPALYRRRLTASRSPSPSASAETNGGRRSLFLSTASGNRTPTVRPCPGE